MSGSSNPQMTRNSPTATVAPSTKPSIVPETSALVRAKLNTAIAGVLSKVHDTPEYRDAKSKMDATQSKLEAMRKAENMDGRLEASSDFVHAAQAVKKIESTALAADTTVQTITKQYKSAVAREADEEQRRKDALADEQKRQEQQRIADQWKAYTSPPATAIREHRLIEGISYADAINALGDPYAISKGGDMVIANWQKGRRYWTGYFINYQLVSWSVIDL